MEYQAVLTREGGAVLAEFPDCPGCQTFARKGQDIRARAKEALEGWLELALEDGEAPPRPTTIRPPKGAELLTVSVEPRLGIAIALRWARLEAGWTQAELARRVGVSQQQIAKLERSAVNPTVETLEKLAAAFGMRVAVAFEPELANA